MGRSNKRLEYMAMYHEPKIQLTEVSSPQKKKPQSQPEKKSTESNVLFNLGTLSIILGITMLLGLGTWNALGGYDMSNIVFLKNSIPGIICCILGLLLHHIDGREVKR